jgi:hypothetical protein
MEIHYTDSRAIYVAQFVDLLRRSNLAERRPIEDDVCMAAMLRLAHVPKGRGVDRDGFPGHGM